MESTITELYDFLIVGSGIYGATFAREATDAGYKCLVIESRSHIGGNVYSEYDSHSNIHIHKYGPHIFHTDDEGVWNWVNRFATFNNYCHMPKAVSDGRIYSLPFNMNTFTELYGHYDPISMKNRMNQDVIQKDSIETIEDLALSTVGREVYRTLIKNYTWKQWQEHPTNLPASILKRIPVRFTYDNRYFDDKYQGVPENGYTDLVDNILSGISILTNVDYFKNRSYWDKLGKVVVFTGQIDKYFDYEFGDLNYRTLYFRNDYLEDIDNYQGAAVINDCSWDQLYTRVIEHKHFSPNASTKGTWITKEFPVDWSRDKIPYYPINNKENQDVFNKYKNKAKETLPNVIFGGRLGSYRYYDMHQAIGAARSAFRRWQTSHQQN